jgi:hypothetical protein
MAGLPQFDYIFAIATIFAFLDAWNIGTFTHFHLLAPPSLRLVTFFTYHSP